MVTTSRISAEQRRSPSSRLWWADEHILAGERFENEFPTGWSFSEGVRWVDTARGRALVLSHGASATWHQAVADGRLTLCCERRSAGRIRIRDISRPSGRDGLELRIEHGHLYLERAGTNSHQLADAPIPETFTHWIDVSVIMQAHRVVVTVGAKALIDVADAPRLPRGWISFQGIADTAFQICDVRLVGWPRRLWPLPQGPHPEPPPVSSLVKSLEPFGPIGPSTTYPEDKLKPGLLTSVGDLPLKVRIPVSKKDIPWAIHAALVPPNFVHTWAIDIKDISSFKLDFDLLDLHWAKGDLLIIVNSANAVCATFKSNSDIQKKSVTVKKTAKDTGDYARIYLIVRTSAFDKVREFRLLGLKSMSLGADPEALLVADDLNYDSNLGPLAFDSLGYPLYQPWLLYSPQRNPFVGTPPAPQASAGWYLLGKNTADTERGFYSLVYYNERKGRLAVYLFNRSLETAATGHEVTFTLHARGSKDYELLDGAFFSVDPRPGQWHKSTVTIPLWPRATWSYVEVPVLYPMARKLPGKQAAPATQAPQHYFDSVYEEARELGHSNILLRITVTPYQQGALTGDVVGEAIGTAVQVLNTQGKSLADLATAAADAISSGKDWAGAGKWMHEQAGKWLQGMQKANYPATALGALPTLVALGASAWGGALGVVGFGFSLIQSLTANNEPLKLSLELALRADMSGSIYTPLTPAHQDYFLPGRLSMQELLAEGMLYAGAARIDAVLPRYERPIGLFGYRYDPGTLKFRVWLVGYRFDDGYARYIRHIYPIKKPPSGKLEDPPLDDVATKVYGWLPVIFNPYAEIVPLQPKMLFLNIAEETGHPIVPKGAKLYEPWFEWVQDLSPKVHVKPDPADGAFPSAAIKWGQGSRAYIKAFGVHQEAHIITIHAPGDDSAAQMTEKNLTPLPNGIWIHVVPSFAPCTYRGFAEIDEADIYTWWDVNYSDTDPNTGKRHEYYVSPPSVDPFPLHDVMYYWDIAYYYYGCTRRTSKGVPLVFHTASMRAPVLIDQAGGYDFNYSDYDEPLQLRPATARGLMRSVLLEDFGPSPPSP